MGVGVMVQLRVEDIASSIRKLDGSDREMLLLLLSGKERELAKRRREVASGKVKTMSREEIFRDVL
ncbi:MAG: hypothetical protein HZA20_08230 [Nitrospirae bacterium]|nr:hypothetical protein [Nitrospirota bacterium]